MRLVDLLQVQRLRWLVVLVPWHLAGVIQVGSIRTPAALNGIFGFKPSAQKIPTRVQYPLSKTLDTLGPLHDLQMILAL